ncbi:unannotated protein [freshwater metagenome]|uniref:Unannotated protein n=1 Tax=freshwater metagenome TaxID=449393 RepID=A0A6J7JXL6_9ZZZZ
MALLGDVLDDRLDGLLGVAEAAQRTRDGLVDDLHRSAADELLELHEGEVRLDPGGVAIHHEADGAGGRQHGGLCVAPPVLRPHLVAVFPGLVRKLEDIAVQACDRTNGVGSRRVLAHDALVGIGIAGVALVSAHDASDLRGALVGRTGHQARDGSSQCASTITVIGQARGHEQCTQVGESDPELAVLARGVGDRLRREVREADGDIHRGDDQLDGLGEIDGVEGVVILEELEQVQTREVARGVVQAHVLRARVGRGDASGLGVGVPVIDGVVVLDAGIGALPRGLADLLEQSAGIDGLDDLVRGTGTEAELTAILDGAHEVVGDTHRVVGVLVLDARDVLTAKVHVKSCVAEDANLALLGGLGLDELLDVRVVDVENDHLRRATSGTTGLDRAR